MSVRQSEILFGLPYGTLGWPDTETCAFLQDWRFMFRKWRARMAEL